MTYSVCTVKIMSVPLNHLFPFAPVTVLFLAPADSDLQTFLVQAHALIESSPGLLTAVEADLDTHGLRKKTLRIKNAQWQAERSAQFPSMPPPIETDPLELEQGRPRTPAYVVLIALLLRGYWGDGFKNRDVTTVMLESKTLEVFFSNLALKMPGRSTLTELVNAVSNETRSKVLDAQLALAQKLELDDFAKMLMDSTHVEGNTSWPTDSRIIAALTARLLRVGQALAEIHLPALQSRQVERDVIEIAELDRDIDLSHGKKHSKPHRRHLYKRLLKRARRVRKLVTAHAKPLNEMVAVLDILPTRKALAVRAVERLHADLASLAKAIAACEARVLREKTVPMNEKVLSTSDPDAGFISKGQREPVIGYKPQIARSGAGFITGLLLPQGNAADAKQLVPMFEQVVRRTGVIPSMVSIDDGYASGENVAKLKERVAGPLSINGSKGRALTDDADWNSDEYADARNLRSAIESMMFTLKHGFDFGEVARRGLPAVHAELLEKALAYNLWRMARLRRAARPGAVGTGRPLSSAA